MKMVQLSLALACLLAGADAFGATPPTCDGHTGNLAVLAAVGSSCDNIAHGHDPTRLSCENADGSDNLVTIGQGVDLDLKALCPEKCGHAFPCGHAPKVDNDAIGANWAARGLDLPNCAAVRDVGLCETDLLANWFCGESCRGGAPWDECMWHKSARQQIDQDCADPAKNAANGYEGPVACEADSVAKYIGTFYTKTARQQIDDDCAIPKFLATYGYTKTEACVADNVDKYIGTSKRTCPGDTSGAGCYYDKNLSTCPGDVSGATCYYDKNLFNAGSTQVAQCPGELDPFRRRKLTRSGTHSDAMKTKGVFTLTASGSK